MAETAKKTIGKTATARKPAEKTGTAGKTTTKKAAPSRASRGRPASARRTAEKELTAGRKASVKKAPARKTAKKETPARKTQAKKTVKPRQKAAEAARGARGRRTVAKGAAEKGTARKVAKKAAKKETAAKKKLAAKGPARPKGEIVAPAPIPVLEPAPPERSGAPTGILSEIAHELAAVPETPSPAKGILSEIADELAALPSLETGALTQVEARKFDIEPKQETPAQVAPSPRRKDRPVLPGARVLDYFYDDTRVALLVRDPEWVFVYWEIGSAARESFGLVRPDHGKRLIMRWYDVTDLAEFTGSNAHRVIDVEVHDHTRSWYQKLPVTGRRWCADLGVMEENGQFRAICRSNFVRTPCGEMSPPGETETWMIVPTRGGPRRLIRAPRGASITALLESEGELAELGAEISDQLSEADIPLAAGGAQRAPADLSLEGRSPASLSSTDLLRRRPSRDDQGDKAGKEKSSQ
jgi:hypothetical protein